MKRRIRQNYSHEYDSSENVSHLHFMQGIATADLYLSIYLSKENEMQMFIENENVVVHCNIYAVCFKHFWFAVASSPKDILHFFRYWCYADLSTPIFIFIKHSNTLWK